MRVRDFLDPNHNWNLNLRPNPCTVNSDSKADTLGTNTTVCFREVSTFGRCLLRESWLCIETFKRKIHNKFIWVQYFVIIMVQYWSNFGVNNLLYLATHVCSFVCSFVCFFSVPSPHSSRHTSAGGGSTLGCVSEGGSAPPLVCPTYTRCFIALVIWLACWKSSSQNWWALIMAQ